MYMEDGTYTQHRVTSIDLTLENAGQSFEAVQVVITYLRYDGTEGTMPIECFPLTGKSILVRKWVPGYNLLEETHTMEVDTP